MPFNLLLLPLLAGYLFLTRSNLRAYSTSQLSKDQLLLQAALHGVVFLVLSRAICLLALQTEAGNQIGKWIHEFAPFPYSATAFGTLLLAWVRVALSNLFVSEQTAGFWLYHRGQFDPLTRVLWCSSVGELPKKPMGPFLFTARLALKMIRALWDSLGWRLFRTRIATLWGAMKTLRDELGLSLGDLPSGSAKPIILSLKDGRFLVGYLTDLLTNTPNIEFVTFAPIWSGYRDATTNKVYKAVDYSEALKHAERPGDMTRVIRTADIAWASLFNPSAFEFPSVPDAEPMKPKPPKMDTKKKAKAL